MFCSHSARVVVETSSRALGGPQRFTWSSLNTRRWAKGRGCAQVVRLGALSCLFIPCPRRASWPIPTSASSWQGAPWTTSCKTRSSPGSGPGGQLSAPSPPETWFLHLSQLWLDEPHPHTTTVAAPTSLSPADPSRPLRARRQIPAGVRKGGFSPARPALTWALPPDQRGAVRRGRGLYLEEPSNLPTHLGILPSVPPRTCSGRPSIDCPPPRAPSAEHRARAPLGG
ncbi:uncharacterized protein LOC111169352 [Delphinapterus leucas]|uniref:Uncharacterized protein LOC111169352 n=1 Tax=Delphinapterus leucas TaxID=9749 RepID=A0A7F8K8J3_DELLE|nr:uncharacterized protein LOC111169352 [Delphinapterus leucas]